MVTPICYLDTNHLSRLVRTPNAPDVSAVLTLLQQRQVFLAFSVIHMVELSHPAFKSFRAVGQLLDSSPIAWAVLPPVMFDREIEAGIARSLGFSGGPITIFYDSPAEALNDPSLEGGLPSTALDALRSSPRLREMLLDAADDHARTYDAAKGNAAAVQRPLEPILSRIREYYLRQRAGGGRAMRPIDLQNALDKAGGVAGFPAYQIYQSLNVTRLKDTMYKSERNDILDEWHAIYAAYADVTVLDRRTVGRLRSTRLPVTQRVTNSLADSSLASPT